MKITEQTLGEFKEYLIKSEKSRATVEKYVHDAAMFKNWREFDSWKEKIFRKIA